MSMADQPSILTVCLNDGAAKLSRSEIDDLLAGRSASLFAAARGEPTPDNTAAANSICDSSAQTSHGDILLEMEARLSEHGQTEPTETERCPACDDSACGMDVADIACNGTAGRVEGTGHATASFFHADSGKKALELLRVLRFDLLVTGDRLPDMAVSQLVRRVRAAWPWQKWALVGSHITTQDEITARTLGAMAVFDAPPDWQVLGELADGIRSRAVRATAAAMANVGASGYASAVSNASDRPGRRNRRLRPGRGQPTPVLSGSAIAKPDRRDERSVG